MDIKVSHLSGGATVVSPQGKLNMTSAIDLREAISALVGSGQYHLIVDLSAVDFIDSSGLGGLVSGLKRAREAGGDLRLAAPNEQVRLVLQLTNLDQILITFEDAESAFRSWPQ